MRVIEKLGSGQDAKINKKYEKKTNICINKWKNKPIITEIKKNIKKKLLKQKNF